MDLFSFRVRSVYLHIRQGNVDQTNFTRDTSRIQQHKGAVPADNQYAKTLLGETSMTKVVRLLSRFGANPNLPKPQ